MITVLATRPGAAGFAGPLDPRLAGRVRALDYDTALAEEADLAPGPYVFADLDRLAPRELRTVVALHDRLAARPDIRAYNHPARVMRRYELLRALHQAGINDFDVYRLIEGRVPGRFPVFLRQAHDRGGPMTSLIADAAALERAHQRLLAEGEVRDEVLVVEYSDTRDGDGVWRRYETLWLAGRAAAVAMAQATDWIVGGDHLLRTAEADAAAGAHLRDDPHRDRLHPALAIARIEIGRVEYAVRDGQARIWDIDTGAAILARLPDEPAAAERMLAALDAIDAAATGEGSGP